MLTKKTNVFLCVISFAGVISSVQADQFDRSIIDNPYNLNGEINIRPISSFPDEVKINYIDRISQSSALGFLNVDEKIINSLSLGAIESRLLSLKESDYAEISWKANTQNTSLQNYKEIGTLIASESSVSRVFSNDSGIVIRLDETRYNLYGGGVLVPAELINTQVNGNPAMLLTEKSASGKTIVYLGWGSNDIYYIASTNATEEEAKLILSNLASELP